MLESMAPTSTAHAILLLLIFPISAFCAAAYSPTAAVRFPLRQITSTAAAEISGDGDSAADPGEKLAWLAAASVIRARHLKGHKKKGAGSAAAASVVPFTRVPLFPHSYGGYSVSLGFGTPEQKLPLVLDTGSELAWFPCTKSYQCRNCSASRAPNAAGSVPVFFPKSSSSARLVGCRNPKCAWIHTPEFLSRCRDCPLNGSNPDCSPVCPPYMLIYGSGSTGGLLLSESLWISPAAGAPFPNFIVGCSLFSSKQPPAGIAGFGRGPASLPSQLGLARFSYCLISRRYDDDDAGESGSVVLGGPPKSSIDGFSFTPFLGNPSAGFPFSVYYYLGLRRITVDGKKVKMPSSPLMPVPSGDGGTIIDSGTTFTYMDPKIFEPVARAVEERVAGRYNRSAAAEERTGLRPCFALASAAEKVRLPELAFHFKGGGEMRLPLANYFATVGSSATVCLTIVTDAAGAGDGGPSVILGSFQQQNYDMVYDLERERLGFRQQPCLETP